MFSKITIITSYVLVTLKYLLLKKEAKKSWNSNFIRQCCTVYPSFIKAGASADLSRHEAKYEKLTTVASHILFFPKAFFVLPCFLDFPSILNSAKTL